MIEQSDLNIAISYLKTPECQKWLKDENIQSIYENKDSFEQYMLENAITQVLIDAGIDPFIFIKVIPMYQCEDVEFPTDKYVIPNNIKEIAPAGFPYCKSLRHLIIPCNVDTIGSTAFYHCTGLTVFNFPDTLSIIQTRILEGCSNLISIYIPSSVTHIESAAFILSLTKNS